MSLGGTGTGFWYYLINGNPLQEATWNAYQQGIVLVASAGNDGTNTANYPASYDWVMSVGASNSLDNLVTLQNNQNLWGSNYGSWINLVAPGLNEYTLHRNQGHGPFSGTSCASPMVSGVAGLILSESEDRDLNLTNDDVWHLMNLPAASSGVSLGKDPFSRPKGRGTNPGVIRANRG